MANIITGVRIVCAVGICATTPLSHVFYILYIIGGMSDMIDGTVARLLDTADEFGKSFDTIADTIFFLSCFYKISLVSDIKPIFLYWALIIFIIKIIGICVGIRRHNKIIFPHTILNKTTGVLLYLVPFFCKICLTDTFLAAVCIVATVSAAWEFFCIYIDI